jgi:hypothetical protein
MLLSHTTRTVLRLLGFNNHPNPWFSSHSRSRSRSTRSAGCAHLTRPAPGENLAVKSWRQKERAETSGKGERGAPASLAPEPEHLGEGEAAKKLAAMVIHNMYHWIMNVRCRSGRG